MSIKITIDNGLEEKIVQLDENMSVKEAKEKTGEVNRWFLKKPHRRYKMVMSDVPDGERNKRELISLLRKNLLVIYKSKYFSKNK